LFRRGNKIIAHIENNDTELLTDIRSGKYKHFSIALYPELHLRHIGILGAVPPAVKGLNENGIVCFHNEHQYQEYQFSAAKKNDDTNELTTDDNTTTNLNYNNKLKEYAEQLQTLMATNTKLNEKINELTTQNRKYYYNEYANSITLHNNPLTPSQRTTFTEIMELAHQTEKAYNNNNEDTQTFSENNNILANKLKTFIEMISDKIEYNDHNTTTTTHKSDILNELELHQYNKDDIYNEFDNHYINTDDPRYKLHQSAKEYCKQNPGIDYADAIECLTKN